MVKRQWAKSYKSGTTFPKLHSKLKKNMWKNLKTAFACWLPISESKPTWLMSMKSLKSYRSFKTKSETCEQSFRRRRNNWSQKDKYNSQKYLTIQKILKHLCPIYKSPRKTWRRRMKILTILLSRAKFLMLLWKKSQTLDGKMSLA